ncbi:MAG: polyhydroxyalkanoate synthesis regulator DNA-binding domain-containing protein [Pseudobdellovibrionaceae bacterium]
MAAGLGCAHLKPKGFNNLTLGEATLINQMETVTGMKASNSGKIKIIKRYQNRKLYDTQQSCYVTLDDIAKMIRGNEEVMVIDNKSKNDITAATLTQIIFESEKKASQYAPLFTLREIIQNGNGSISSYLAKLGAFPQDYMLKQAAAAALQAERASSDDVKQNLEARVASAAARVAADNTSKNAAEKATILPGLSDDDTPNLPTGNT